MSAVQYAPNDQVERLGAPPWSGPALEAWERAHGHDVRLDCESAACFVLIDAYEAAADALARLVSAWDRTELGTIGETVISLTEPMAGARAALRRLRGDA